jgi:hypothetical protein
VIFDLLFFPFAALKSLANALRCLRFSPCEWKK